VLQIYNLQLAGSSLRDQGKLDEALVLYTRALDASKNSGDKKGEASTLRVMAALYRMTGEYSRAIPLVERSLSIGREIKDAVLEVKALNVLGVLEYEEKHYDLAVEHFSAGLKVPSSDDVVRDQLLNEAVLPQSEPLRSTTRSATARQDQTDPSGQLFVAPSSLLGSVRPLA
jgi:tetratricopeptide (TPR) repeat protein